MQHAIFQCRDDAISFQSSCLSSSVFLNCASAQIVREYVHNVEKEKHVCNKFAKQVNAIVKDTDRECLKFCSSIH